MNAKTITGKTVLVFTVQYLQEDRLVETYAGEYRNLMVLLNEKVYLEGFGECGGMGRCGTCVVEITGGEPGSNTMIRNEASTLGKAGVHALNMRLACQVHIDEALHHAVVKIAADES